MDESGAMSGAALGRRKNIAMLRCDGSMKRGERDKAGAWGVRRSSLRLFPFALMRQRRKHLSALKSSRTATPGAWRFALAGIRDPEEYG
jgi:hypothetical protein